MLKAGALYYAIAVSLLIGLISGSMVLLAHNYNIQVTQLSIRSSAEEDIQSGMQILLSGSLSPSTGEPQTIQLFDENGQTVEVQQNYWGLYQLNIVSTKRSNRIYQKAALSGVSHQSTNGTALYLTDNNRPLSLCGKTVIKGTTYLPKAGVKRAYIEGQNYIGSDLIYGKRMEGKRDLPAINSGISAYLQNIDKTFIEEAIVESFDIYTEADTIKHSFFEKTLVLIPSGPVRIDQYILGRVAIQSAFPVTIASAVTMKDVIISAPTVTFERRFQGAVQVFATDSIIVEEQVVLQYPSSLVLLPTTGNQESNSHITIKKAAELHGTAYTPNRYTRSKGAQLIIQKDAIIYGEAYADGVATLEGSVFGSLYTKQFYLKTRSSTYTNTLLNATVDYSKLSKYQLSSHLLAGETDKKGVVKWLY